MRALVSACLLSAISLASLGGCVDNDRARVQSLSAGPNGTFTYRAQTDTVMTENDDGAAERIRREWLAQTLGFNHMCPNGYLVDSRGYVVDAVGPFGNGGDIVYRGRCL